MESMLSLVCTQCGYQQPMWCMSLCVVYVLTLSTICVTVTGVTGCIYYLKWWMVFCDHLMWRLGRTHTYFHLQSLPCVSLHVWPSSSWTDRSTEVWTRLLYMLCIFQSAFFKYNEHDLVRFFSKFLLGVYAFIMQRGYKNLKLF